MKVAAFFSMLWNKTAYAQKSKQQIWIILEFLSVFFKCFYVF